MGDLLRFSPAVPHDTAIDAWLRQQRADLRPLVETWFARMRQCGPDVRELMHDGCPTACVQDAAFGYVNAFRDRMHRRVLPRRVAGRPHGLVGGHG